jgi:tetratricopeptide (TPR) repeat protein
MKRVVLLALLAVAAPSLALAAPMAGDKSRYESCLAMARATPQRGIESAQAWRIEGGGVPARHCLAIAQFGLRDYAEALKNFEAAALASAAAQDGQAVSLWAQGADAALIAAKPDLALRFLDEALKGDLSPKAAAALRVTRAETLVDLKRLGDAAADLETATTLDPGVRFGWLLKATLARRTGDLKAAEASILKAAEIDPGSAEVQLEAGNIASAQGNATLARAAWQAAADADPESVAGRAAAKALRDE